MKVSFPLSLKVTVWLLLNLLVLAAVAIAFLVAQGGLSWDSLVAGTSGDRFHSLANVIAGEVSAASPANRNAVLERFGSAYHAEFIVVRNHGPQLAGVEIEIPPPVRQRIDEGPPGPRGFDGPPEGGGAPGLDAPATEGPPGRPANGRAPNRPGRGRFLEHTSDPSVWWIGLRVPFADGGRLPAPATLVVRAHSFWSVMLLLNLETWLLVAATVLVLSVLFWLPLVRSITRQVRALSAATEQIAEGKFETRVATNRRDELGRLGESVNSMAARLEALVSGQKRFLGDVAHELGSPLGRLQVATEILEDRADPKLRDQVNDVREEVQHMAELVNELLAFTKAGLRPRDAALTVVEISPLFAKVANREDPDGRVQQAAPPNLRVLADEPLLTRAVGNLVRNALRYAPDSKQIILSAIRQNGHVVLSVEDEGPGVPVAALDRLGEPFFRPEFARQRETGGVGLGLAIVRSAVTACGGQVKFSNRTPRGFRAEIRLTPA